MTTTPPPPMHVPTSLLPLTAALCVGVSFAGRAQAPAAGKTDTWGKAPVPAAGDDRYSNPKKPLYAGPDGWYNAGEVRATVANAAHTAYNYKGSLSFNSGVGVYHAVGGSRVLSFDFGSATRPVPGTYKVGAKGSVAQKTVHMALADVGNQKILEWSAADGAGTLTVKLVNGFTYFTCRRLTFAPSGMSNRGAVADISDSSPKRVGRQATMESRSDSTAALSSVTLMICFPS